MQLKQIIIASALTIISSTSFALHNLEIRNNTNVFATAKTKTSPCSSVVGDQGILKPHGSLTVYQIVEDLYCKHGCEVEVYVSKNCSGSKVISAHVDYNNGVTSVTNNNPAYRVVGSGYNVSLEGGPAKKGFFNFLFG